MNELAITEIYEAQHEAGERLTGWLAAMTWSTALYVLLWILFGLLS